MAKDISLVIAIAEIYDDSGKSVIGYRLANVKSDDSPSDIKDVPSKNLRAAIADNMHVENMDLVGGELCGTQGSLSRLPSISLSGKLLKNNTATIAYRIGDAGFKVLDFRGRALKLRDDDILTLVKQGRIDGISNGKVVNRDGIEYISAINGDYKKVELKKQEATKRVKSSDLYASASEQRIYGSTVNMQNSVVRDEIDYNDTFYQLTKEQREALELYYTWWTSDTFKKLSDGGREELKANPKKVAQLAELRGTDIKWVYEKSLPARLINKQGFDYCTLGHKLYMVHFAKGTDAEGGIHRIKFGSTCAADFFDISPKSMSVIIKVSDTMKKEIEKVVELVKDQDALRTEIEGQPTMMSLFKTDSSTVRILFGDILASFGANFIEAGLPFPESYLKLCRVEALRRFKDPRGVVKAFLRKKGADEAEVADFVVAEYNRGRASNFFRVAIDWFVEPGLEGIYGYDPLREVGERGKGRFDKTARAERRGVLRILRDAGVNEKSAFNEVIKTSFALFELYKTIFDDVKPLLEYTSDIVSKTERMDSRYATEYKLREAFRNLRAEVTLEEKILIDAYMSAIAVGQAAKFNRLTYGMSDRDFITNDDSYNKVCNFSAYPMKIAAMRAKHKDEVLSKLKVEINKTLADNIAKLKRKEEEERRIEEEKQRKELEAKRAEREQDNRDEIVCLSSDCPLLTPDGGCKYIREHGIKPEFIRLMEGQQVVSRCDTVGVIKALRSAGAELKKDEKSEKNEKPVETEKVAEKTEKKSGDFRRNRANAISDEDNWKKELKDNKDIEYAVDAVLRSYKNGAGIVDFTAYKIAMSCKRYGRCSAKQWVYLEAAMKDLRANTGK